MRKARVAWVVAALMGPGFAHAANHCLTMTCSDISVWNSDISGSPVGTNEGTRAFTICPSEGDYYDWKIQKSEKLVTVTDKVFFLTKSGDASRHYESWIDRAESVYSAEETVGDSSSHASGKCAKTTLQPIPKRSH